MVMAAVAATVLAGTQAPSNAAPRVAAASGTEFDGFGIGRSKFLALRDARTSARQQAAAAGFDAVSCSTIFEDASFDRGLGAYFGESDIVCN